MTVDSLHVYIQALDKELAAGNTTEHTHRPALKALFQGLNPAVTATNEPQHITAVGAPDFRIIKNKLATGYVECKDIGINLDEVIKTEQLKRYLKSFQNLLVTDYLEFRWYVKGELRLKKSIGTLLKDKIKPEKDNLSEIESLLTAFLNSDPEPIGSPKELAGHMARLAHMIREIIINALKKELVTGSLHAQWQAFRENLIPELSVEQFADMYSQTIAYGLFAARCETDNGKEFSRQQASFLIPKTNPFLRKLFNYIAGPELDESITWAVDDLSQILAWADMEAVLKDFGTSTGKADPVVHFYETFLKEYDPKTREMRGVYYTPLPVVSYIVRSIDHILKTSFEKPQGLADPSVLILDPAVGTATFLYMVMQEIHEAINKQGQAGTWDEYVAKKLLPRLFGFEILMAPYAIAHLKLGRLLKETGYQFQTDQRLGIYLTNTLEESVMHAETMFAQWITEEANAAADIKKTKPIMVVLGNPPYSGHSVNKSEWAKQLIETYKKDCPELYKPAQAKWLQDDYVKFLAFGQWRIERTGYGILGFITNHAYLDNPTFRGMRQSLMNTFTDIYILNLHGNSKKKEVAPDGSKDENVFDIQQGVAICLMVKKPGCKGQSRVQLANLWGLREGKYQSLSETDISGSEWEELTPHSPYYLFVNRNEINLSEYMSGWKLSDIMSQNGDPAPGMVTTQDEFAISWDANEAKNKVNSLIETDSEGEARSLFRLCSQEQWNYERAKHELSTSAWLKEIKPILYRPFDIRWTVYNQNVAVHRRERVMRHMLAGTNIGICTNKEVNGNFHHILCSREIINDCTVSLQTKERTYLFPLYLYPSEGEMQLDGGHRRSNLNPDFIKVFSEKLELKFVEDGKGDLWETFGPEDIFNYAYSVFHSPEYRSRYAEFLKIDFPRLPLTSNKELFKALAEKGAVLVSLHLMESPLLNNLITKYEVKGDHTIDKVGYDEITQRVSINKTQYFNGVLPEVWNFRIGGYQVCEKWLKDRKGRKLIIDDIDHYQKIVVALKETIRLMSEIDETIEENGGWPAAFE